MLCNVNVIHIVSNYSELFEKRPEALQLLKNISDIWQRAHNLEEPDLVNQPPFDDVQHIVKNLDLFDDTSLVYLTLTILQHLAEKKNVASV